MASQLQAEDLLTAMGISLIVAFVAVTAVWPAGAGAQSSSPPAGWCSETGDTCFFTEQRGGVRYVELRWPEPYADSGEICVIAPNGRKDCVTAASGQLGEGVYGVSLDWPNAFPHRGPGVYTLDGPPAIADVGFAVGPGRTLCRPNGSSDLPGYRYRTEVRTVSCAAAKRVQVRAERLRCARALCPRQTRSIQGYRCRFGPLSATRFEQAISCTNGRRSIRWIRTYD
jgi:hypothetical protein